MSTVAKCPIHHAAAGGQSNASWWPTALNLKILRQHSSLSDPMDQGYDYAKEFEKLASEIGSVPSRGTRSDAMVEV